MNLKSFPQIVLEQIGIVMDIDNDVYEHNSMTLRLKCPDTDCPIYSKMKNQYIFSEKSLNHLLGLSSSKM